MQGVMVCPSRRAGVPPVGEFSSCEPDPQIRKHRDVTTKPESSSQTTHRYSRIPRTGDVKRMGESAPKTADATRCRRSPFELSFLSICGKTSSACVALHFAVVFAVAEQLKVVHRPLVDRSSGERRKLLTTAQHSTTVLCNCEVSHLQSFNVR